MCDMRITNGLQLNTHTHIFLTYTVYQHKYTYIYSLFIHFARSRRESRKSNNATNNQPTFSIYVLMSLIYVNIRLYACISILYLYVHANDVLQTTGQVHRLVLLVYFLTYTHNWSMPYRVVVVSYRCRMLCMRVILHSWSSSARVLRCAYRRTL